MIPPWDLVAILINKRNIRQIFKPIDTGIILAAKTWLQMLVQR